MDKTNIKEDICVITKKETNEEIDVMNVEDPADHLFQNVHVKKEEEEVTLNFTENRPEKPAAKHCFTCSQCGKSLSSDSGFRRHMKIHTGERPHSCSLCGKGFITKEQLTCHIRMHTGEKPFTCTECEMSFRNRSSLRSHQKSHHRSKVDPDKKSKSTRKLSNIRLIKVNSAVKPCVFSVCGKGFLTLGGFNKHKMDHIGEKTYKCSYCEQSFKKSSSLKSHEGIHTGDKPHVCSECGKTFAYIHQLKNHHRVHTGEKPYTCSECGKTFAAKPLLTRHIWGHRKRPFSCAVCGKCFASQADLNLHRVVHMGLKLFTCSECNESFSLEQNLKKHEELHKASSPFTCSQCGQGFRSRSSFKDHQRIHTQFVSFSCEQCNKTVTVKSQSGETLEDHAAGKPFCSSCGKSFSCIKSLKIYRSFSLQRKLICSFTVERVLKIPPTQKINK